MNKNSADTASSRGEKDRLREALVEARETILDLIHARDCQYEGTDADMIGFIDAALATDATDGATGGGDVRTERQTALARMTAMDDELGLPDEALPLSPNATTTGADLLEQAAVVEAGRFLLERLVDHEVRMESDSDAREWFGHVTPAMSRFRDAIRALSARNLTEGGEK